MAEARPVISDVGGILKFDANGDINSMGPRWNRWKRGFELFALGKGVVDPEQKKSLLLHTAGISVQDIYFTLQIADHGEEETVYDVTVRALDAHFTPQVNSAFERSQFRAMTQTLSETVEQYITRLRKKAVFCDFHNIDENIRDQVIKKCYSQRLRRKLLERNNVTLAQLREITQSLEASEQIAVTMEQKEEINKVSQHKFDKHCPKVKNQISNKDDVLRVGTRDILRQTFNVQQGERNVENARKKDISNNVAKQTTPEITTRGVVTQL
jgi:archaeosine-15-forming tRNA-guanine transglycosylase